MTIGIIGSMHFSEQMLEAAATLRDLGHTPILSQFIESFLGKTDAEKEQIKLEQKLQKDAQRRDWERLKDADAFLVINIERRGIANYIGGNTFMEMAAAYFNGKKIFLLNPIPHISFYQSELEAMKPVVIQGDYALIQ